MIDTEFWVAFFGFLGMLAGFIYTWFREARQHKWTREAAEKAYEEANQANKKIEALRKDLKKGQT